MADDFRPSPNRAGRNPPPALPDDVPAVAEESGGGRITPDGLPEVGPAGFGHAPEDRYSEYDDFAWFYDRYWSLGIPLELLGVVERLLLPHLSPGARILDVCCGTGRIAGELVARGFRVTGIDGSDEMLRHAHINAPAAEFIAADARAFRLPPEFDAAISLFDSLNHVLSLDELARVFRNVRTALVTGGWFVFDLNLERSFERFWRGDTFTTLEPDHASMVCGTYDPQSRLGQMDVTLFRLRDGTWHRADLAIQERCYAEDEVRTALAEAGFGEIHTVDAERELGMADQIGRMFFLAHA